MYCYAFVSDEFLLKHKFWLRFHHGVYTKGSVANQLKFHMPFLEITKPLCNLVIMLFP